MFGVIPLVEFLGVLGLDIDVNQKNPSTFVCHVSVLSVAYRLHRVASSRLHPPSRLKPMKDANKLGSPLRTQCKPPRTPYARWGEGSATRSTVEGDCSVWSSPVRQDCGASSARQAVQGGKLHLWMLGIHRDATSAYAHGAIVARIYATHNPGFLQKTFRLSHTVTGSDNPASRNLLVRFPSRNREEWFHIKQHKGCFR